MMEKGALMSESTLDGVGYLLGIQQRNAQPSATLERLSHLAFGVLGATAVYLPFHFGCSNRSISIASLALGATDAVDSVILANIPTWKANSGQQGRNNTPLGYFTVKPLVRWVAVSLAAGTMIRAGWKQGGLLLLPLVGIGRDALFAYQNPSDFGGKTRTWWEEGDSDEDDFDL